MAAIPGGRRFRRGTIEVTGLRKTYPGGVEAVRGIDFAVAAGETFGLLGPNGAGKSTTVGVLTTTVRPTGGTARVAGHDVTQAPMAVRRASSVVFQDAVVDRTLTGLSALDIHARLWSVAPHIARRRTGELLDLLGIRAIAGRPVGGYSGGERRRLEIARALVSRPAVLFLDEPTVGLDPRIRHEILDVIGDMRREGEMTVLLTTHYLDEAERLCDRIAVMRHGEIAGIGSPAELRARLGEEIVELRVADDGPRALALLRRRGIAGDDAFCVGSTLTVPLHGRAPADAVAAVHALGMPVASIGTRSPTLDDVYLQLTGDRLSDAA